MERSNHNRQARGGTTGSGSLELVSTARRSASLLVLVALFAVGVGAAADIELPGPLSAAHQGLEDSDGCVSCHDVDFNVDGARCLACHDQIEMRMTARKGVHREVTTEDCAVCHAEHGGRDADLRPIDRDDFDHSLETGFALEGYHGEFAGDCSRCHTTRSFMALKPECSTCHQDVHKGTLGADCTTCHTVDSHFRSASRAFHKSTFFPLQGRHLEVPCASCHWNGMIEGTPTRCYDCHWIRRQDDPFRTRLGSECENCHQPISWTATTFNHAQATGYPLGGRHQTVDCTGCHPDRRFDGPIVADCFSCHRSDYERTDDPDHSAAAFPTDCAVCHRPTDGSWHEATFDHPYRLAGVHATLECAACHASGVYAGLPSDCVDCHLDDYNATANPIHGAAGFSTTCNTCHRRGDSDWYRATYPHDVWPLVGAHTPLSCTSCHGGDVYVGLPSDCVNCHLDDYSATDDPDHPAAGFPTTCEDCHTPAGGWDEGGGFGHSYQLVGVHATLECADCHASGVYAGLPSDCVDCHLHDYSATSDPNHSAAGFPTTCDSCHQRSDPEWNRASYPHSVWPLLGSHTSLPCTSCHTSAVYAGLPSECVDCHRDDYNATTDPDHPAAGFPTTCEICHRPTAWSDADFTHTFLLVGAHATADCSACHGGGVYAGTPTDCAGCHLENYNGARDPNHRAAGFPIDCELCHRPSDASWNQGRFNHTAFPITSGPHASADCADCHINPSNFGVFSCLDAGCHPRSEIDDKHEDEPGYVYDSAACYSCHPNGRPPGDKSLARMRSSHGGH